MRFDLMSPANYSGGVNNSFLPIPTPQLDLMQSLGSFGQAPVVAPTIPPVSTDSLGSLTGLGSFGSYGAMDAGYSSLGGVMGQGAEPGFLDFLKNFPGSDWGKAILGSKGADGTTSMGLGSLAVGGLSAIGNLYMGMKNYGLMKDQLDFAKSSFNKNFANQVQTTNTQLADRQAARYSADPTAYQSPADYMKKNGLKG